MYYTQRQIAITILLPYLSPPSLFKKRKERSSAIMKNSKLNKEQKEKWLSVISNDTMSSEESGPEDVITVHSLPWRSQYVNKMGL